MLHRHHGYRPSRHVRNLRRLDGVIEVNLTRIAGERDCTACGNGRVRTTAHCASCHGRGRVPR